MKALHEPQSFLLPFQDASPRLLYPPLSFTCMSSLCSLNSGPLNYLTMLQENVTSFPLDFCSLSIGFLLHHFVLPIPFCRQLVYPSQLAAVQ